MKQAVRECPIPYPVMWAVAKAEYGQKPGYPYIIRINRGNVRIPWLRRIGKNAYDCRDYRTCVYTAGALIGAGITNIDLGPFQINYRYHHFPPEKAFLLPKSYLKACGILVRGVKKYGWNWEGIATYHSTDPKENREYAERLERILVETEK